MVDISTLILAGTGALCSGIAFYLAYYFWKIPREEIESEEFRIRMLKEGFIRNPVILLGGKRRYIFVRYIFIPACTLTALWLLYKAITILFL